MIRRLLLALDDSARAPAVFRAGEEVARAFDAEVWLLRVIFVPEEFPAAAAGTAPDELEARMTELAQQELAAYQSKSSHGKLHLLVRRAATVKGAILSVANELGVDLIVLGSHGYAGLDRLFGTTAGAIADKARCNVLVVHSDASAE